MSWLCVYFVLPGDGPAASVAILPHLAELHLRRLCSLSRRLRLSFGPFLTLKREATYGFFNPSSMKRRISSDTLSPVRFDAFLSAAI